MFIRRKVLDWIMSELCALRETVLTREQRTKRLEAGRIDHQHRIAKHCEDLRIHENLIVALESKVVGIEASLHAMGVRLGELDERSAAVSQILTVTTAKVDGFVASSASGLDGEDLARKRSALNQAAQHWSPSTPM